MKIVMIMYGRGIGGAEFQFLELAEKLALDHSVTLISLGGDGAVSAVGLGRSIDLQVFAYDGKFSAMWGLVRAWLGNIGHGAQAIVTTSVFGNFLGLVLNLFGQARLVSLQTVSKAIRYPALDRFVLKRFDKLIAGSSDIRDYLQGRGQDLDRIEVVNNWVDFSSREITVNAAETRAKFGLARDEIVIGCIGRMHPQKAQEFLIRAFRALVPDYPQLRLVLVGDGETMAQMRDEAKGLDNSVLFTGSVLGNDYNNLLNAFDIYVQPSRFEGLPRTLLDAMFFGKPIVATAVNGNRDAICPSSGFLEQMAA